MRNSFKSLLTFSLMVGALAPAAMAQGGPMGPGGGWGMSTPYGRMYDSKTVEVVQGEVVSVDRIKPVKGMSYGIHAILKTDKESISVHFGPAWYMDNQDIRIEPKDRIEVKGSRISYEGQPALIAAEVKKGDEVLMLRDANGFPAWSGWQRR